MANGIGKKGNSDFASDEAARPSQLNLPPTRRSEVQAGLEEADPEGKGVLFHAIVTSMFRIGRDPEANLVIRKDGKTSRQHASITQQGMKYFIEDNASSNGTFVNDVKLTGKHELKVGDKIRIGRHEYTFARRTTG